MRTITTRNIEIGGGQPRIVAPIVGQTYEDIIVQAADIASSQADIAEWRADYFIQALDREAAPGYARPGTTISQPVNQGEAGNRSGGPGTTISQPVNQGEAGNRSTTYIIEEIISMLAAIRTELKAKPLIFTYRTESEGGAQAMGQPTNPEQAGNHLSRQPGNPEQAGNYSSYTTINKAAISSGLIDLIDIELAAGEETINQLVEAAHASQAAHAAQSSDSENAEPGAKVAVILSSHDFGRTPEKQELIDRMCRMQDLGADICKVAVMPNSPQDVLTLLEATSEMYAKHADRPIATMSMSDLGKITRIAGGVFGSALTYGAMSSDAKSAPGQLEVKELRKALHLMK